MRKHSPADRTRAGWWRALVIGLVLGADAGGATFGALAGAGRLWPAVYEGEAVVSRRWLVSSQVQHAVTDRSAGAAALLSDALLSDVLRAGRAARGEESGRSADPRGGVDNLREQFSVRIEKAEPATEHLIVRHRACDPRRAREEVNALVRLYVRSESSASDRSTAEDAAGGGEPHRGGWGQQRRAVARRPDANERGRAVPAVFVTSVGVRSDGERPPTGVGTLCSETVPGFPDATDQVAAGEPQLEVCRRSESARRILGIDVAPDVRIGVAFGVGILTAAIAFASARRWSAETAVPRSAVGRPSRRAEDSEKLVRLFDGRSVFSTVHAMSQAGRPEDRPSGRLWFLLAGLALGAAMGGAALWLVR